MKEEKVKIKNQSQEILGILHIPDVETDKAIIIAHGYGGYIFTGRFRFIAQEFCKSGYTVLRFAFRGYNSETGDPSPLQFKNLTISGETSDLKSAIDFMNDKGYKRLGFASESLGGAIFLLLNDKRIKVAALWSVNIHIKSIFDDLYGEKIIKELGEKGVAIYTSHTTGKSFEISKNFWEEVKQIGDISEDKIRKINCPMLIIHGTKDQYFSTQVAKDLYNFANEPKKLFIVEGANHTFTEPKYQRRLIDSILDWFEKWIA